MSVPLPGGAGLDNLEGDQIRTFKDFLISYNKLTELCFNDCISDFTSRNVKNAEFANCEGEDDSKYVDQARPNPKSHL